MNAMEELDFLEDEIDTEGNIDHNGDKEYNFRLLCKNIPNTNYLTHNFHSYPAKFIPHIPNFLIRKYSARGETILDPFCGSGTALLEAKILGRNSIGIDINPLSYLITSVKTREIRQDEINFIYQHLQKIKSACMKKNIKPLIPDIPNINHWFSEKSQMSLGILNAVINNMGEGIPDKIRDFFRLCFSAIIRKVSNADPKISKPFVSRMMREKISNGQRPEEAAPFFEQIVIDYLKRLKELSGIVYQQFPQNKNVPFVKLLANSDARKIDLSDESVDFVITSPPYANAQEYFRSIQFELYWLGLATSDTLSFLKSTLVGTEKINNHNSMPEKTHIPEIDECVSEIWNIDHKRGHIVKKYFTDMEKNIAECFRILRKNKRYSILVGDNIIRDVSVKTHLYIQEIGKRVGFDIDDVGYDIIKAYGLSPVRHHTAGIIDREWIITFLKH